MAPWERVASSILPEAWGPQQLTLILAPAAAVPAASTAFLGPRDSPRSGFTPAYSVPPAFLYLIDLCCPLGILG